jgi:hypothetical protein
MKEHDCVVLTRNVRTEDEGLILPKGTEGVLVSPAYPDGSFLVELGDEFHHECPRVYANDLKVTWVCP